MRCILEIPFSHVRELISACLQPSWPHSHAFLGQRSRGENLCRGDAPAELIISSRKCLPFAKSCSALGISSVFQCRPVSIGFCSALSRGSGFFHLFSVAEVFVWSLTLFMHTSSSSSLSDFETSFYNPSYQQPLAGLALVTTASSSSSSPGTSCQQDRKLSSVRGDYVGFIHIWMGREGVWWIKDICKRASEEAAGLIQRSSSALWFHVSLCAITWSRACETKEYLFHLSWLLCVWLKPPCFSQPYPSVAAQAWQLCHAGHFPCLDVQLLLLLFLRASFPL